jgi:antitoxin FitA
MVLAIELGDMEVQRLREAAARLGVAPEELARALVADQLAKPHADFDAAATFVLEKNAELYRRLEHRSGRNPVISIV